MHFFSHTFPKIQFNTYRAVRLAKFCHLTNVQRFKNINSFVEGKPNQSFCQRITQKKKILIIFTILFLDVSNF